ncbi:MAG: carbamoyltransferase HypF [Syntrophaceae bacterium]|nr:carbamoyltransferase HypF [Syntrophaceae bacterium]
MLRRSFELSGVVQGVGFRPYVYSLARKYSLQGWVKNSSAGVHLEVEGPLQTIEQFTEQLPLQAPPRSRIESLKFSDLAPAGYLGFEIRESQEEEGKYQLISPDIATCSACQEEIFNPSDRRHRYPFTNCTNCGPRFTIIEDIPYDRPKTTMAPFRMCPDCRREYEDPGDRRFHAQPNACPVCGPQLQLVDAEGKPIPASDPIAFAIRVLKEGKILAIKGLGGFLLACDAQAPPAVEALRQRKHRPDKPFAVMLPDLSCVREHCRVNPEEEKLLQSPESPIVLLPWKRNSSIARAVAPGQKYLGVMLPYTPLHHLLMKESGMCLVMTSGNRSEEPISKDNEEALIRLKGIADAFLLHDRGIFVQYDDSVTTVIRGQNYVLRRARGYAPFPIRLSFSTRPVLACGGELKNTFCLTRDGYAFVSQHIGDLENLETLEHFQRTVEIYQKLFRIQPEVVAYDLHPEYLSTKFALSLPGKKVGIQHHFAHLAGCLAENGEAGPAIGLSFDGLGYGTDGALWGGEFLVGDFRSFRRKAHFEYLPVPGGEAAIRHPWRMALSYVYCLLGKERVFQALPLFARAARASGPGEEKVRIILQQIDRRMNTPLTSSCGRLFDGVSALLGICPSISFEGQAAMELEMIADSEEKGAYEFFFECVGDQEIIRLRPLIEGVLRDLEEGISPSLISGRFHNTLVRIGVTLCQKIRQEGGPEKVTLSGGVFQNRLLLERMKERLEGAGFKVLVHRQVPCNDGGLSLGQAVIANFID